jgi:hypothetical protein
MSARENLAEGRYENNVPYASDKEQRRRHRDEEHRLNDVLRADLEQEHGVVGHAKADRLWALAWEHGHSSGYGEVITYYEDFVTLVQP